MKLRTLTAALALIGLLGPAGAAVPETRKVPTEGGLHLATDLYLPERTPAPAILIRTPYGRKGLSFLGEAFSARGYAVAVQDVRGRYGSDGEHTPFLHERADGLASLRWVAAEPWCDGRIGMWGSSYSGYAALVLADVEIDAFRSLFSISGWLAAEEVVRPGGTTHLLLDLPWMLTQQGRHQRNLSEFDVDALFRHRPLRDALRAAGIRHPQWEDPAWLEKVAAGKPIGRAPRPVFQVTGWHDMVYRATLDAWERLAADRSAPRKLAIGPWYHNQMLFGEWEVGDEHFGEASGFGTEEMISLSLRWFDATLKGIDDGILKEPPVSFFLMGQNAWHRSGSWPPAAGALRTERWYLESGGAANGLEGDGRLSRSRPTEGPSDRFTFDPEEPVPTLGGANFFYFPELLGVRDQREIERREDVLVYSSAPLAEPMQITGPLSVELHAASSAPATDFTAKLVIVRPDGYARIVEEGIARVKAAPEPRPYRIELGHTAIEAPRGHRLRVEISSSNFPKYDRNPNTGEDPFLATEFRKARQTVFHSPDAPSALVLPVRRKPLVATADNRRPLVRPAATEPRVAAAAAEGDDAAALLSRGREQLREGEADAAIATLGRGVELEPESSELHHWLGRAYLDKLQSASLFRKLGLSRKVRASYRRAIELDPENMEARDSLAQFYFNAPGVAGGSEEAGLEQVAEIRRRDPRRAHLLMAGLHREREETGEAIQAYRAAIALKPEDPDPYYSLGLLFQVEKRWDEAFETFEAAVKGADDLRCLYQIGRTGVFSGRRLAQARRALEEYIRREPDPDRLPSVAAAHWRLGMLYEHLSQPDRARREYAAALELDPELEGAREALERL